MFIDIFICETMGMMFIDTFIYETIGTTVY